MEIHQLRYFVAAAEAESISRAADRCAVAQPSLSQQIKKLETSLGVTLFDRLGRGVALTDAGRALLPRARSILSAIEEAEANLQTDLDEGAGRLAVGAIPTMAPYVLPGALTAVRTEFPRCDIIVREDFTENLIEALIDNRIDIAVVSTPIDHDLIDVDVIGVDPLLVCLPTKHPLRSRAGITLRDLRDQPTVTLHEMHCLGQQISAFCAARRLARNVVCRTTQLSTVLEFVRLGLGISLIPEMAARHDHNPERGYVRLTRQAPSRDIALAWRKGRTRPKLAVRFAETLRLQLDDRK